MHHTLILVGALMIGCLLDGLAYAQPDSTRADTVGAWTHDLTTKLLFSQSGFKDWKGGRSGTASVTTSIFGTAQRTSGRWNQQYDYKFAFGVLKRQDAEGRSFRKTEDQIHIEGNLRYEGKSVFRLLRPTISGRLRTQFAKGFNFSDNLFPDALPRSDKDPPVQISEFMSPVFITESIGLTFVSKEWYTVQLGLSSKQAVVRDRALRGLYDLDQSQIVRIEGGIGLSSTVERNIAEDIVYRSQFDSFIGLNKRGSLPDFTWENYLNLKVNEWLSANIEFAAIFNENTIRAVQLKEKLSVGLDLELR